MVYINISLAQHIIVAQGIFHQGFNKTYGSYMEALPK